MNNKPRKLVLSQETVRRLTAGRINEVLIGSVELNCSNTCSDFLCSLNGNCTMTVPATVRREI